MAKQNKQETLLTPSGHEADKELMKVPIKVSPALQALLANQIDLMEMLEVKRPPNPVFIEQHRLEVLQLEEEIAAAFSTHAKKKEKARQRQEVKRGNTLVDPESFSDELIAEQHQGKNYGPVGKAMEVDQEISLDALADKLSPGLPSSKFESLPPVAEKQVEVDIRRVALGASIKTLIKFLGRELTEEEMSALEAQVDSYLNVS